MVDINKFFKKMKIETKNDEGIEITGPLSSYENLIQDSLEPLFIMDKSSNIITYNRAFSSMFESVPLSLKEMVNFLDKEQINKMDECYKDALKGTYCIHHATLNFRQHRIESEHILTPIVFNNEIIGLIGLLRDITKEQTQNRKINRLETSIHSAEAIIGFGIWDYDVVEDVAFWSDKMHEIFELDKGKIPSYNRAYFKVHPEDQTLFADTFKQAINNGGTWKLQYRILQSDGTIRVLSQFANCILNENGQTIKLIGTTHDITNKQKLQDDLTEVNDIVYSISEQLDACVWSKDVTNNHLIFCSKGIETITGYSLKDFKSSKVKWEDLLYKDDLTFFTTRQQSIKEGIIAKCDYRIVHRNGKVRWVHDKTIPTFDEKGSLIRLDGIIIDITDQKEASDKINYLAHHDYLTGLPNRKLFEEEVTSIFQNSKDKCAIMHVDLDGFKRINDTLGHGIGDKLLKAVAARLTENRSTNNVVARMGGDEFTIMVNDIHSIDELNMIAKNLLITLNTPYLLDDLELYISASIGISMFPEDGHDLQSLQKKADAALYRAKDTGKNNYKVYTSTMNIETFKTYTLERDLRKAIKRNELSLFFQPIIDLNTNEMTGAEALIRWEHPDWGLVFPKEFINLAEENGFIFQLTDWTFRTVCTYIKQWEQMDIPLIPVSINVSSKHFTRDGWVDKMLQTLEETEIDPALIEIEITESALIENEESFITEINRLKEHNIKLSLDDFGTGYSSLLYLNKFAIDTVKIDRYFINQYLSTGKAPITKAIIELSHELGLRVVAEGVETFEQLSFLKEQQCDQVQGYIYSKPLPVAEFQRLLVNPVLEPIKKVHQNSNVERRKVFRFDLPKSLCANMTILEIKGNPVQLGNTEVLIENIGFGGLRFISHLQLPEHSEILLRFETEILHNPIELVGTIVWKAEAELDFFKYGVQFKLSDLAVTSINPILNKFSIQLKKNPLPEGCRFGEINNLAHLKALESRPKK